MDTEGAWAKGNRILLAAGKLLSGPRFYKVSGALCAASFPFAGRGNK